MLPVITLDMMMEVVTGMPFSIEHLTHAIAEVYIGMSMVVVCLALGKRLLDNHSASMRYIADGSYWVYIIHLPVLFFIQFLLLDVELGAWNEFWVSSFGTLAIGFISYALLIRWTPIGILLNGRRVPFGK